MGLAKNAVLFELLGRAIERGTLPWFPPDELLLTPRAMFPGRHAPVCEPCLACGGSHCLCGVGAFAIYRPKEVSRD
jgi:hypothetical protein